MLVIVDDMLLAEDLLLLLTDDATGKLIAASGEVDVAIGGAMLVELTLMQRVDVAGTDDDVRKGRLLVRDSDPTGDHLLDEALAKVAGKQGKKPESAVGDLGSKIRSRLYARLDEKGLLRQERGRILGIFPTTRWPAEHAAHEEAVRARLASALRAGRADDDRTGALIALLRALKVAHKALDPAEVGLTKGELKANAKRIAEGDWASAAVRRSIESMNAAIVVTMGAAAASAAGSSS